MVALFFWDQIWYPAAVPLLRNLLFICYFIYLVPSLRCLSLMLLLFIFWFLVLVDILCHYSLDSLRYMNTLFLFLHSSTKILFFIVSLVRFQHWVQSRFSQSWMVVYYFCTLLWLSGSFVILYDVIRCCYLLVPSVNMFSFRTPIIYYFRTHSVKGSCDASRVN